MANDLELAFGDARRDPYDCRPAPICDPRPVCPACGGLECLCRPRFFAGQLLSEEDLNRLDHYMVAKNRLHNRHLFGSGVVCGLEVVCAACDPAGSSSVVVKPGYALSPCGNDIVVCAPESVNICDLINRCRPRADDCVQPGAPIDDAARGDEEWVLAICYKEKPSRGVTALQGASCGCKSGGKSDCGCGGSGASRGGGGPYASETSCGCGCGGGKTRTANVGTAAKPGPRPPQCEPTLTCETYSFAVYKVKPVDRERRDPGALIKRFICCVLPLVERLTAFPIQNATIQARERWLLDLIQTARDFLRDEGLYDCEVTAMLNGVAVPVAAGPLNQYMGPWTNAVIAVLEILVSVFQKCLCAALLPPCPPPELNDCVPIATVTVTAGKCRVRHVCNISHRRFLIAWPALRYWLGWLPPFNNWGGPQPAARTLLERLCCTPVADLFGGVRAGNVRMYAQEQALGAPGAVPHVMAPPPPHAARLDILAREDAMHPFTRLLAEAMSGRRDANAVNVLLGAMGARSADDEPLVSEAALRFPGQAMLIHQVIAPALAPLVPFAAGAMTGGERDVDSLTRAVEELRQRVERQDEEIERLRHR